jgi:hypothetical protein
LFLKLSRGFARLGRRLRLDGQHDDLKPVAGSADLGRDVAANGQIGVGKKGEGAVSGLEGRMTLGIAADHGATDDRAEAHSSDIRGRIGDDGYDPGGRRAGRA